MVTLIAAISNNNVIGTDGHLPWNIPEDLKHFKTLTTGKTVLMGRKTWESIPEKFRPLPGRTNIVITRQRDYQLPEGVQRYTNIDAALKMYVAADVFVIGGAEIYAQTIGRADRLEITQVDQTVEGDVTFPAIDSNVWQMIARDEKDGFSFVTYVRV